MDHVNYQSLMLRHIVTERLIASDPFTLFDVGCSLGIDPVWRFFGEDLHAHGFDPLKDEIEELTRTIAELILRDRPSRGNGSSAAGAS